MTEHRPPGLPVFTSPAAPEDIEPPAAQRPVPIEQGAQFLPPPSTETDPPPQPGRRSPAAGSPAFSTSEQQP